MTRRHIMINLFCSVCRAPLRISEDAEPENGQKHGQTGDPTGGDCRFADPFLIEPCRSCIERETGPASRLIVALRDLVKESTDD